MSKLYFYKCVHFLLFLSLSTVLIHQFHFYTKILTLITLISTPISSHSHHSHPVSSHSHHSPHSVPRFPIPAFTDSRKFMLCIWDCISVLLYMYQLPNTNMSNKYCQRYLNIVLSTLKQLQLINVEPTLICNQIILAACFCLSCVKYFVLSVIEESFFAKHQLFKYIRQKLTQILP